MSESCGHNGGEDQLELVGVEELFDRDAPRLSHRVELAGELRRMLDEELAPLGGRSRPLWISKSHVADVSGCEAYVQARRAVAFVWSDRAALGSLADTAAPAALGGADATAAVEQAFDQLVRRGDSLGVFLDGLTTTSRELLVAEAISLVDEGLVRSWPAMPASWFEHQVSMAATVGGGAARLRGVPDLLIGRLVHPSGASRALLLDFKAGAVRAEHVAEQRFYGLLATLACGRPPWRTATYYLASGQALFDDISEELLFHTARHVANVARRSAALEAGDPPAYQTGPSCRWCPIRPGCPVHSQPEQIAAPALR